MEESSAYVNGTEMLKSDYFRDLLREKITDTIYEEREKMRNLTKYYLKMRLRNTNVSKIKKV